MQPKRRSPCRYGRYVRRRISSASALLASYSLSCADLLLLLPVVPLPLLGGPLPWTQQRSHTAQVEEQQANVAAVAVVQGVQRAVWELVDEVEVADERKQRR
jgi:hypothetical protein